jgi:hypothetical protein
VSKAVLIDDIIRALEKRGGYTRAAEPPLISGVDFKGVFDAVLVGPKDQNGLVLVRGAEIASMGEIRRVVKAFTTALDRTGSTRPITLVLATMVSPDDPSILALQDSCRVITVPAGGKLEGYLRVLLPLKLPSRETGTKTADSALRDELEDSLEDPLIAALIRAARKNSDEVQRRMREEINRVAALGPSEMEDA